jgi:membrane protein implicated in regulation of membrane protease activity
VRSSPVVSRILTITAVAFLTFDGAALAALGMMSGRLILVAMGVVLFMSAGLILLYWRWYRRTLDAITAERSALKDEARKIQHDVRAN